MGKKIRVVLAVSLAVFAALMAPSAVAGGLQKYNSHIGISKMFPAFHGDVDAEVPQCVPLRKVQLYREKNGDDKRLGTDQTDGTGEWAITEASDGFVLKSGAYYAKVNASLVGGKRCRKDLSRIVVVD